MIDGKVTYLKKPRIVVKPRPLSAEEKKHLRHKIEQAPERIYTVGGVVILALMDEIQELRERLN